MKEVVYGLGGVSAGSDGGACCPVIGERWEQQGVACNERMNELGVAKAKG